MKARTAAGERQRGVVWLVAGVLFLGVMFAGWWLVATTNREGHHDAHLLPLLALIPLGIGAYHLLLSRFLHHS
jgi:hypothetical protein